MNSLTTGTRGTATTAAAQQGSSNEGYGRPAQLRSERPITMDDVIAKTAIVLGVIIVGGIVNYVISLNNPGLGMILTLVGAIGGLIAVMVSSFGKKYGSSLVTLIYAAFEGLFVGGFSFLFTNMTVAGANAGAMIGQAVLGTIGVFIGMLFVYKTGVIRVTPKFTKFLLGAIIGVLVLVLGNLVFGLVAGEAGPLRDGGPLAWIFSIVCIVLAALSFLLDFDQVERLIGTGAPASMAWGAALGLAVTLVWLYTEILRALSYLQRD